MRPKHSSTRHFRLGRSVRRWGACLVLATTFWPAVARAGTPGPVDFSREILPIFSDNCFRCHGPDAKTRKAGLRLDLKEQALRATDPVIVPGKSDESEVILRVTSRDPDEVMPPPKSGRSLTPAQVERLKRWIDEGATWGRHWALEPPRRSEPPAVRERGWPVNPIDRFVLARLEAEG
ncbi:MAG: hypothetical protein JO284_19810, partial [Planctomycetaceae bacterium]|nr:hypothetical protein [Planctomycetaceae bacterium]